MYWHLFLIIILITDEGGKAWKQELCIHFTWPVTCLGLIENLGCCSLGADLKTNIYHVYHSFICVGLWEGIQI